MKRISVVAMVSIVLVAAVAFAGWIPWRNRAKFTSVNETEAPVALTYIIQRIGMNDHSPEPKVLREWRRNVRVSAGTGANKKVFFFSSSGRPKRFIARPFFRGPRHSLGAPAADFVEFVTGDAFTPLTFTIGAPVTPPVGQYPPGLIFVDTISGTSYSRVFTRMSQDASGAGIPSGDVRANEVEWAMSPVVVAPGFGSIIPGYFNASVTFVPDVEGWYSGRVPLSTTSQVPFANLRYERGKSTVFTIVAATKAKDGMSFIRRQPQFPTSGSTGTPLAPN